MRSKEEIEKEIKELNEEHNERIDELNEELKNIKSAIPWKPEVGDACFCIGCNPVQTKYESVDEYSFYNGYIVKTLDEAQRKQARDRINKQLKDLATQDGRRDGEFISGGCNYFISFDVNNKCIDFDSYCNYQFPDIVYFPDESSILNALDIIGREKIKYAYFGGSKIDE